MLLDAGADVNLKNKDGWTALMSAIDGGNVECIKCLVGRGADVNSVSTSNDKT